MYWEQPVGTSVCCLLNIIILMNVIKTDGAQRGVNFSSAHDKHLALAVKYVDRSVIDHRMLTAGRSVVQDPLDEHQGSHVKKQQDKEEQLWEEFKEQAGVPLEIPKTRPQRDVMIECASLIVEGSFNAGLLAPKLESMRLLATIVRFRERTIRDM